MTIKEIFEHSQNVDGWILGIDGYASKVDLGNPAILAGIGKYRVKTIYPDVHDGKVVVEPDLADLQNMIQTKEVSDEQADAYLRLAAAAQEIEVSSLSAGDAIQFIANNTGLTVEESAKLADELGYIDSANTRLAQGFVQLADGTWEYRSACEKAADGTWKLKNAEDGAAGSADDMTGALGDVEVATYDANTAAAKLTKSLFDANGKLTEHAKKALTTNTALADLAKKELELQNAATTANYNNLIA